MFCFGSSFVQPMAVEQHLAPSLWRGLVLASCQTDWRQSCCPKKQAAEHPASMFYTFLAHQQWLIWLGSAEKWTSWALSSSSLQYSVANCWHSCSSDSAWNGVLQVWLYLSGGKAAYNISGCAEGFVLFCHDCLLLNHQCIRASLPYR